VDKRNLDSIKKKVYVFYENIVKPRKQYIFYKLPSERFFYASVRRYKIGVEFGDTSVV
jgi:hypothetical protein